MLQALAIAGLHFFALVVEFLTEYTAFAIAMGLLTWALLNFIFLFVLRRPGVAAVLSLVLVGAVIVLSQFKWGITYMTATFLDVLVIDSDTIAFLLQIFPRLKFWAVGALLIGIPVLIALW